MKYLLILLFLFSTQVFSGEVDGKGLVCKAKKYNHIYWFNSDRVIRINILNEEGVAKVDDYDLSAINGEKYIATIDNIYWQIYTYNKIDNREESFAANYCLNRKTLNIYIDSCEGILADPLPFASCKIIRDASALETIIEEKQNIIQKLLDENKF